MLVCGWGFFLGFFYQNLLDSVCSQFGKVYIRLIQKYWHMGNVFFLETIEKWIVSQG